MTFVGRAATYVLPAASIGIAALAILGPGAQRAAVGVRLWGLPSAGGETLSLRVEGVRRLYGVEDAAALDALEVSATSGGSALGAWTGATGAEGIGEAWLNAPGGLRPPLVVRVSRAGETMLEQEIPLSPPGLGSASDAVPGAAQGDLDVRVAVTRGVLAAPFPEEVRVTVSAAGGAPARGARVDVTVLGGDLTGEGAKRAVDDAGGVTLEITPRSHLVELSVRAAWEAGSGQWEGHLPVLPGAIWLEPPGRDRPAGRLRLVSPAPRDRAYVSLVGEHGRERGAVVTLTRDNAGFSSGEVALELAGAGPLCAVVAGDPYEQGAGTVVWPLVNASALPAPPRIARLADGLPAAEAREQARAWRARRAGLAVLGATAIAEVVLLLLQSRSAQRRLEAHLADAAEGPEGPPLSRADRERLLASARAEPALRVLAFAALVALAFAIVAALATFR